MFFVIFTFLRLFGGCYSFFVHFKLVLYDSWDDPPQMDSTASTLRLVDEVQQHLPRHRDEEGMLLCPAGAMNSWAFYVILYHFWYGKWFFKYVPIWGLCISLNSRNPIPSSQSSHGLWAEANPHVLRSLFGIFSNLGDPRCFLFWFWIPWLKKHLWYPLGDQPLPNHNGCIPKYNRDYTRAMLGWSIMASMATPLWCLPERIRPQKSISRTSDWWRLVLFWCFPTHLLVFLYHILLYWLFLMMDH